MSDNTGGRPAPTFEDILRAVAYLAFFAWTVVFLVLPPVAYVDSVDFITRLVWMASCGLGALTAFFGAIFRFDLKMELPGLIFMMIGPVFFFAAQVYYLINPPLGSLPNARTALSIYALLPFLLTLPRMYALYAESRRVKKLHSHPTKLTPEQEAQPGAFKIKRKGT